MERTKERLKAGPAFLFDLDGTLVDSVYQHVLSWREALEAAGIWLQADPSSAQARQIVAALLVSQSQLTEARPHLERWLAADRENVGAAFLQLNSLLARHKDKAAVLKLLQSLAQPYREVPEAHLTVAQAALTAGDNQVALDEGRAALKLRPDWEAAAKARYVLNLYAADLAAGDTHHRDLVAAVLADFTRLSGES